MGKPNILMTRIDNRLVHGQGHSDLYPGCSWRLKRIC
ncbi:hypothetical protein SAMN05421730_1001486 [Anaerobium acetethylicum]|uniref:Uncharacterized protein n=1 Tax=Anaerobium acetethylicum TaxID=1619234 RepID=A0A1D3TPH0_9FIRM|nr:hypothetical protein SAMN05421730_1001486 [Anaerobium acetethylicum]